FLAGKEPRQRGSSAAWIRGGNRGHRSRAGRGFGIRSAGLSEIAGTDCGWAGRCSVWFAVFGRAAAGALFLALRSEQDADAALRHFHEFETDGYGDLLQSFSDRGIEGDQDQVRPVWV